MPLWDFRKDSTNPASGANTQAGYRQGYQPAVEGALSSLKSKRNVILTNLGWVYRENIRSVHGGYRQKDQVLVAAHPGAGNQLDYASNTYAFKPDVAQVYVSSNSTGGTALQRNSTVNVYVVFTEPVRVAGGRFKLNVANTIGGNAVFAYANNSNGPTVVINANNTLVFRFVPSVAGTYKIKANTVINATASAVSLVSRNSGGEQANLVITGAVSNTSPVTFTVRSATTGG